MIRPTHEAYARVLAEVLRRQDPAIYEATFITPEDLDEFVCVMSLPDRTDDVEVSVPLGRPKSSVLGHSLSSLQHFQVGTEGYRWRTDPSLSGVGGLSSEVTELLGMEVGRRSPLDRASPPPLACTDDDEPIDGVLGSQGDHSLGVLSFPPALTSAGRWSRAAVNWMYRGNVAGWRRCLGYALHFVQDSCVPHHAWGSLLGGHLEFEEGLRDGFARHLAAISAARDDDLLADTLGRYVVEWAEELDNIGGASEMCLANREWSRREFGEPRTLSSCGELDMLKLSTRALASSLAVVRKTWGNLHALSGGRR
jgi:hypothetical protein